MAIALSRNSGCKVAHWNACMPPAEVPITALRCGTPRTRVSNWYWASTTSRMEKRGNAFPRCPLPLEGEEETPFPNASTAIA